MSNKKVKIQSKKQLASAAKITESLIHKDRVANALRDVSDLSRINKDRIADTLKISVNILERSLRSIGVTYQDLHDYEKRFRIYETLNFNPATPLEALAEIAGLADVSGLSRYLRMKQKVTLTELRKASPDERAELLGVNMATGTQEITFREKDGIYIFCKGGEIYMSLSIWQVEEMHRLTGDILKEYEQESKEATEEESSS